MQEKATKSSWKRFDMPCEKRQIIFDDVFTKEEFELIQYGHIPEEMEDKWFIYYADHCIYFHRSWTGYCIFEVYLKCDGEKYSVSEAWMNIKPGETNDWCTADLLKMLVNRHFHRVSIKEDMLKYIQRKKE